jgi:glucose-6-phosphate 1-dehydrogenase
MVFRRSVQIMPRVFRGLSKNIREKNRTFHIKTSSPETRAMKKNNRAIVIIGASGDLAKRKLVPAVVALSANGKITPGDCVIGVGRTFFTDRTFREHFNVSGDFAERIFYHQYIPGLKKYIAEKGEFAQIVFFLAQPPEAYSITAKELVAEGFGREVSLVIEKPFGYDYESAKTLNRQLLACFNESQIFRIDHYLAKEAVQNILVFRFANTLFNPIWNGDYIESIQINALEDIGILDRARYFDKSGIIRDMVQNHLLQLLSLLTMEAPASLSAGDICFRKSELLKSVAVVACHRSQYNGYLGEKGVAPESTTDTFAELALAINNPRWKGVPVYIRTGKAANRHGTEIGIRLKKSPQKLFNAKNDLAPNQIIFKIQPAEGIIVDLSSKVPGAENEIASTNMNFCYRDSFARGFSEAYERLINDAILRDHTLFVCSEDTETAWKLLEPVLDKGDIGHYDRGTLPESKLAVDWISFEKYEGFCG